ncbi:MAG: hypothetical protein J6K31_05485 [Parabacteroides sp.]|nr:hypothetical protein [Parabacteroides sp.]
MGWFGTSKEDEFKDKLVDFWNLLVKLSCREISWELAANKYNSLRRELICIAQEFQDPFSSYFRRYTYNTGILGEKTSIGEGIAIVILATDYYKNGRRFSQNTDAIITNQVKEFCSTEDGKNAIREIIRSSYKN